MVEMTRVIEAIDIVGGAASVIGLAFTVRVLFVARGARRAAEDARSLARKKNLVEELDEASQKLQQVGIFLQQRQWFGIQLRIDEVAAICRSAMTRWPDHLTERRKNDVLTAVKLMRSIAALSAALSKAGPSAEETKDLLKTHSRASELINDALGEAHKGEERDDGKNGN
jgi:hypothetical protein